MSDPSTNVQKIGAEVIGTFTLVFFGCGAAIVTGADVGTTGLAFGLTVLVGAYAFGRISGAHFNPAVSVGAALGGRMAWRHVPAYVGAQFVGALLAGLMLFVLVKGIDGYEISVSGLAQNSFGDDGTGYAVWAAFLIEVLMTAIFVWVILAVTDERNEHPALAPLTIGLALAMIHFASIPLTGTSVNPVRSIGVALFAGSDAIIQLWLFIVGPLLGAAIAGVTYPILFGHATEPVAGSGLRFGRQAPAAVPGYGAPDQFQQEWNQPGGQSLTGQPQAQQQSWEQEPIIQDGWQWDHQAQEWKPLEQWQPAPAPQAGGGEGAGSSGTPEPTQTVGDNQSWTQPDPGPSDPDAGGSQIRPPS